MHHDRSGVEAVAGPEAYRVTFDPQACPDGGGAPPDPAGEEPPKDPEGEDPEGEDPDSPDDDDDQEGPTVPRPE